jgi:hypothetical protein
MKRVGAPQCLQRWRRDPLYHELKESHSSYEAQHDWWRDRYKVAADDLGVRPGTPPAQRAGETAH